MRFPWIILLCILFPVAAFAQYGSITGTVTSADSKKPIANASVFLSNSASGTSTNESGHYNLATVRPGQYTLVVSILGYEDYNKTVLVGTEPMHLDVELKTKPIELRDVVISSEADWKKNYELFRKHFIGQDQNAKFCVVQNPHILNLTYNQTKEILHAEADEFLIVENKALGYRIKFLVRGFDVDNINGIDRWGGDRVFEDLPGSDVQKKKWHEAREAVYYGSQMHFFRSLIAENMTNEGFIVYNFKRDPNPERLSDEQINQGYKIAKMGQRRDSMKYYYDMYNMRKWVNEKLIKPSVTEQEIASHYNNEGLFRLHFDNFLYIVYTKKREEEPDSKDFYRPLDMPDYEATVLNMQDGDPIFDRNGIIVGNGPLVEGTWAKSRLSDLLPVDYVPDQK